MAPYVFVMKDWPPVGPRLEMLGRGSAVWAGADAQTASITKAAIPQGVLVWAPSNCLERLLRITFSISYSTAGKGTLRAWRGDYQG